ncbi:hypothetical protein DFR52_101640 [Hoeflea marina]|uniref:Uncharacterized protein n=2 Tax=Hoeflea marina TaxID=274592 RepID=A0A317PR38_9HYPH|nr:hypothetical protein DFR52_101640 [Hoeflea marina]
MPVARVVPMTSQSKRPRIPGALKGQFTLPESFFHPLPEAELLAWEGSCSFDAEKGQGETSDFKKS